LGYLLNFGESLMKQGITRTVNGLADNPRILSWECVQGVRYGFEGRNGKNRCHLIGNKSFFRLAKRIKSLRHVGATN